MKTDTPGASGRLVRRSALTIATVMALLLTTFGTASAQDTIQPEDTIPSDQVVPTDVADAERLRLRCAPTVRGDRVAVKCRWSASIQPEIRAYQLYRIVDGNARQLIATKGLDERRMHVDRRVHAGQTIIYGVVGLNHNGRVIAIGGPERVVLERPLEEVRFRCRREAIEGERGILCRWAKPNHPQARGYVLYRSIDGAEREIIHRAGLDSRRINFDTAVVPGAVHIYYLAIVDADGERVGFGGPDRVRWPRVTDMATDVLSDVVRDGVTDRAGG